MTFPMRSFRELRHSALPLLLLVAFAGIAGCGSDNSPDVMVSPPGWVAVPSGGQHATSATLTYISNGGTSSCAECHGADLSGGTSKVSCFGNPAGCHHGPVANWGHPLGVTGRPPRRPRAVPGSPPARSATGRTSGRPEAMRTEPATPATAWPRTRTGRGAPPQDRRIRTRTRRTPPCVPAATGTVPRARPIASTTRCATRSQALRTPWGIPPGMRPRPRPSPTEASTTVRRPRRALPPASSTARPATGPGRTSRAAPRGSPAPTVPTPRVTGPGSLPRTRRLRGAAPRTPTLPPTRGTPPCAPTATGTPIRARPIASITRCATRSQALRTPWGIPPGMRPRPRPSPTEASTTVRRPRRALPPASSTARPATGPGRTSRAAPRGSPAPTVPTPRVTGPGSLPRTRRLRGAAPRTPTLPPTRGTPPCAPTATGTPIRARPVASTTRCATRSQAP